MDNVERAYLAGLFDGEGYLGLTKTVRKTASIQYTLRTSISNNHPYLMQYLLSNYGGSITTKRQNGFINQEWRLSSNQAYEFLKLIYPFLIVKSDQVKLAMEFQSKMRVGRNTRLTEEELETREYYRLKLMELKKYGSSTD